MNRARAVKPRMPSIDAPGRPRAFIPTIWKGSSTRAFIPVRLAPPSKSSRPIGVKYSSGSALEPDLLRRLGPDEEVRGPGVDQEVERAPCRRSGPGPGSGSCRSSGRGPGTTCRPRGRAAGASTARPGQGRARASARPSRVSHRFMGIASRSPSAVRSHLPDGLELTPSPADRERPASGTPSPPPEPGRDRQGLHQDDQPAKREQEARLAGLVPEDQHRHRRRRRAADQGQAEQDRLGDPPLAQPGPPLVPGVGDPGRQPRSPRGTPRASPDPPRGAPR